MLWTNKYFGKFVAKPFQPDQGKPSQTMILCGPLESVEMSWGEREEIIMKAPRAKEELVDHPNLSEARSQVEPVWWVWCHQAGGGGHRSSPCVTAHTCYKVTMRPLSQQKKGQIRYFFGMKWLCFNKYALAINLTTCGLRYNLRRCLVLGLFRLVVDLKGVGPVL